MDTLLFILGALLLAIGLAASIALHELGHLVPAKLFKVRVTKYMVGFGPTVFARKKGDTTYGLKAVPLGGFISMAGMFPPAKEGRRYGRMARNAREGDAEQSAGVPEDQLLYRLPAWKRITIMLGGPLMNLVLAAVLFSVMLSGIGSPQATTTLEAVGSCITTSVDSTRECPEGSPAPARDAGLKAGDTILSFDGRQVKTWPELTELVRGSAGRTVDLTYERDGVEHETRITPAPAQMPHIGKDGEMVVSEVGAIGLTSRTGIVREPLTAVFPYMADSLSATVEAVVHLPEKFTGVAKTAAGVQEREADSPVSVVGVGRIAGEVTAMEDTDTENKAAVLIGLLGGVNLALFVFNLIPLLPLDGGHIVGALWDALRRRTAKLFKRPDPGPFDQTVMLPLTAAVAALMLAGGLLLIYVDLVKPISLF